MRTVLAAILLLFTTGGLVQAEDPPPLDKTLSPYFFVDGGNSDLEAFPLKSTTVVANISGVIADVTVTQVYENTGSIPINGKYVFPGSTRAAVHRHANADRRQNGCRAHQGAPAGRKGI